MLTVNQKVSVFSQMKYFHNRTSKAQEFVTMARAMIKRSGLCLEYQQGVYRAALTIPYDDIYGFRTLGCIIGNDFLLDCDLIYQEMKKDGSSKETCFRELFLAGVLKLCYRFWYSAWFKRYEDIIPEQEHHKFFCISNDILKIRLSDFTDVVHRI